MRVRSPNAVPQEWDAQPDPACQLQPQPRCEDLGWKMLRKTATLSSELKISTLNHVQKQIGSQHSFWQTGAASSVADAAQLMASAPVMGTKSRYTGSCRHCGPPGNISPCTAPLFCGWQRDVVVLRQAGCHLDPGLFISDDCSNGSVLG